MKSSNQRKRIIKLVINDKKKEREIKKTNAIIVPYSELIKHIMN